MCCHFEDKFAKISHILAGAGARKSSVSAGRRFQGKRPLRHKRAASPFCEDIVATSPRIELGQSEADGIGPSECVVCRVGSWL